MSNKSCAHAKIANRGFARQGGLQKGGFGGCSPVPKTGTKVHSTSESDFKIFGVSRCDRKWPSTEWKAGPTQKARENGKRNGKWPQARNGRKMAFGKNGPQNGSLAHFLAIFPFRRPFFGHFGLGAIFHFLSIFSGFLCRAGFLGVSHWSLFCWNEQWTGPILGVFWYSQIMAMAPWSPICEMNGGRFRYF